MTIDLEKIQSGFDIMAATPGRLKEHLYKKRINLSQMEAICLDEVDQMLKLGFKEEVDWIMY